MKETRNSILLLACSILLGACASTASTTAPEPEPVQSQPTALPLPDLGPAPELENEIWLNTDTALRLEELRGRVVLLDMWTFG